MDATINLLMLMAIFGGAALFAWGVIQQSEKNAHVQPPPLKSSRDLAEIAARQSQEAEDRAAKRLLSGMTLLDWLRAFARVLEKQWGMSHDDAMKAAREWYDEMGEPFGGPDMDWTLESAAECARDYMQEVGESYGSNQ